MVRKIKVALDSRLDDDFLVIARTDARKADSKDEGACAGWKPSRRPGPTSCSTRPPASVEEMEEAARLLDGPLMAKHGRGRA